MSIDWFRTIEYAGIHRITPDWRQEDVAPPQGVRLYRTAASSTHGKENARFSLQIRSFLRRQNYTPTKTLAFGDASMSRADLVALRKAIDAALHEDEIEVGPRNKGPRSNKRTRSRR